MRSVVWLTLIVAGAGCAAVPAPPREYVDGRPVGPPPPMYVYYGGEHPLPDSYGGGWCYLNGQHAHPFFPDQPAAYVVAGGFYYWNGTVAYTYYAGHPLPGGGWCPIVGPHTHAYYPPTSGGGWYYRPGNGYVYSGQYSSAYPPPANYWTHAATPVPPPAGASLAPQHPVASLGPPPGYHPINGNPYNPARPAAVPSGRPATPGGLGAPHAKAPPPPAPAQEPPPATRPPPPPAKKKK